MKVREVYLGDGLYASYDGYRIKLRAPRSGGDHEVYIDERIASLLIKYIESIWKEKP